MVGAPRPRYEIVCRLAGGGMADLFLARAVGLAGFERLVVVKRAAAKLGEDPGAKQALFDEARIAAALSHANIVQVNDIEATDGEVSIVMEFLHGHDVAQMIRRLAKAGELIPLDQAVAIALAVCAGLHHAHEQLAGDGTPMQIVHRDVSPHNVFVTYDGAIKLVDFGIARAAKRRGQTEQGVIKGKPGYIAPEQIRGRDIDRRTDVWATAVLLYEMTTGVLPFGDTMTFAKLVAIVHEEPPAPSSIVPGYPGDLEIIVMRGLARDPANRYPTAEAMLRDLQELARRRKLDLSPYRIADLMERVFARQLGAWRESQRLGKSLAEHIADLRRTGSHSIVTTPAVPSLLDSAPPGTTKRLVRGGTIVAVPPKPGSYAAAVAPAETPEELAALLRDSIEITGLVEPASPRRWPKIAAAAGGIAAMVLAGVVAWRAASSSDPDEPAPVAAPPAPLVPPPTAVVEERAAPPDTLETATPPPAVSPPAAISPPVTAPSHSPSKLKSGGSPHRTKRSPASDLDAPLPR